MYIFFNYTKKFYLPTKLYKSLDTGIKTSTCMGSVSWRVTVFRQAAVSLLTHDVNPLTHKLSPAIDRQSAETTVRRSQPPGVALSARGLFCPDCGGVGGNTWSGRCDGSSSSSNCWYTWSCGEQSLPLEVLLIIC